jgi:hypothetical protein
VNLSETTRTSWLATVLRVALLVALVGAGWRVYHHLPADEANTDANATAHPTILRIIMQPAPDAKPNTAGLDVNLYSVDIAAVQREFISERRPGVRFTDFLAHRMQARPPLTAHFDANGQALVAVPAGRWWIHAHLAGTEEITWRLPVNVSGREQTVELTPDNAYMRTKSF